ncbi:MAG TPA: hypothetical protein VFX91_02205 [Alcanivorax sp.]|nr:hypothetical protein [Alcanivorax sp.]
MATKKYDICVKVGEYQVQGQMKPEWRRVGVVMQGDDGREFALLNRDFNPAGVINPDNRSTVLLNYFEPRNDNQASGATRQQSREPQGQGGYRQPTNGQARPPTTNSSPPPADQDDDIPF